MLLWNRPFPEGKTEWQLTGDGGLWSQMPVSNHREELSLALSDDGEIQKGQRNPKGSGVFVYLTCCWFGGVALSQRFVLVCHWLCPIASGIFGFESFIWSKPNTFLSLFGVDRSG